MRTSKRMKILLIFLAATLLLTFIFVLPEVTIISFFAPIIFAIAFSLHRGLNKEKA